MNALYGLGQALLLALDPELAHDLAVKSLELGLYPRQAAPDDRRLAQTQWGLKFRNPLGMAAGFDKDAQVFSPLLATGFGFVEVELAGADTEAARRQIDEACHKILSNPVIEDYRFEIE